MSSPCSPIHRRVRDRRRAGAVQVGQFVASRAIRPKTTIAVRVALWHRPAGGRLRDGSRYNTLKITDCVNAFTLVFCEDGYGDGVPKPFRPSTNEASHEVLHNRNGPHLRIRQRYFHGSADKSRPHAARSQLLAFRPKWCPRSRQPTAGSLVLRHRIQPARTSATTFGGDRSPSTTVMT